LYSSQPTSKRVSLATFSPISNRLIFQPASTVPTSAMHLINSAFTQSSWYIMVRRVTCLAPTSRNHIGPFIPHTWCWFLLLAAELGSSRCLECAVSSGGTRGDHTCVATRNEMHSRGGVGRKDRCGKQAWLVVGGG
jgi:hypothetical protein